MKRVSIKRFSTWFYKILRYQSAEISDDFDTIIIKNALFEKRLIRSKIIYRYIKVFEIKMVHHQVVTAVLFSFHRPIP